MRNPHAAPAHLRGFTLIEVLIVVAIVGILAATALPLYTDYMRRGRITDATAAVADMRARMERYFLDNRTYLNGGACGADVPSAGAFTIGCAATANTYTVTATGSGYNMAGFTYKVTESGAKTSTVPAAWGSGGSCWITRKGDSCP